MKKTLIAGAASFALAAMPVIGVFAANPEAVVDTLTVTVNESCTFERTSGEASKTKSMQSNQLDAEFLENTFTANCNNGKGYSINAVFTNLAHTGNAGTAIQYSATTPTAGSGTWTASTGPSSNIPASNGTLANTSSQDPSGGSTYTVTYKVSTHNPQESGTYTGTATYTLVQKTGS